MFLDPNMASPFFFHPNLIFQMQTPNEEDPHNHQHQSSILNPQDLPTGMEAMVGKRSVSFSGNMEAWEAEEELSDECSQVGEKKRRLNMEQVRTLEKNFELGNKLEPERKNHLARSLGLQPRQIAIWFQNRRARWKTKQLEKDYDLLKLQFETIKAENDALHAKNKKLQTEIMSLKRREAAELINLSKETEGSCSNRSENSSEINLDNQCIQLFSSIRPPPMNSQLLQISSTPDLNCSKVEHCIPDEHFNSLLCGMEDQDQTAFWPWPDHQNHH